MRPPYEEMRPTPSEFLTVQTAAAKRSARTGLTIRKLHPSGTIAGQAFNPQPEAGSALVVECEHATPGTVIMMGDTMLTTTYGNQRMLSALVPAALYSTTGTQQVYLINDFGESSRADFIVEPPE